MRDAEVSAVVGDGVTEDAATEVGLDLDNRAGAAEPGSMDGRGRGDEIQADDDVTWVDDEADPGGEADEDGDDDEAGEDEDEDEDEDDEAGEDADAADEYLEAGEDEDGEADEDEDEADEDEDEDDEAGEDEDEADEDDSETGDEAPIGFELPRAMSRMVFVDVVLVLPSTHPVVVLQEAEVPYRELRIPIGGPEGIAIGYAARQVATPRPLTHELMTQLLERFNLSLDVVNITGLTAGMFTAELVVSGPAGQRTLDCRPSDAIALALRQRIAVPIMADPDVLDRAAASAAGSN